VKDSVFKDAGRGVVRFLVVGWTGFLFIILFSALLLLELGVSILVTPRVSNPLAKPMLQLYESRVYSVCFSLVGSVIPMIVTAALSALLLARRRVVVPRVTAIWLLALAIVYVIMGLTLPVTSPIATVTLLNSNEPIILATPLMTVAVLDLAHEVERNDYWVAAEAYVTLFTPLLLSDLATALMIGVTAEFTHILIILKRAKGASFTIGYHGLLDVLLLVPIESAIAALITTVMIRHRIRPQLHHNNN